MVDIVVSYERLYVMQTRHELSPATAVKSEKKIVAKNSTDVENWNDDKVLGYFCEVPKSALHW